MSILLALIIGVIVGGVVGLWLLDNIDFLLLNIVLGVAGSVLGIVVYYFILEQTHTNALFSLPGTLCAVIGALLFVLGFDGLHRVFPKRAAHQENVHENPIDED